MSAPDEIEAVAARRVACAAVVIVKGIVDGIGRAADLRAQAELTDSMTERDRLLAKAEENDWHLERIGA